MVRSDHAQIKVKKLRQWNIQNIADNLVICELLIVLFCSVFHLNLEVVSLYFQSKLTPLPPLNCVMLKLFVFPASPPHSLIEGKAALNKGQRLCAFSLYDLQFGPETYLILGGHNRKNRNNILCKMS